MTDVIVLAAGLGRRLAAATVKPKWLAPVGESTPCEVQLAGFVEAGVTRVFAIAGEDPTLIEEAVAPWRDRLDLRVIANPRASDRNNWYSLVLGFEAWLATGEAAVTVANSDLFARPAWFAALVGAITADGTPAALAIDGVRPLTDEAMKVSVGGGTPSRITGIGKVGVDAPHGEYVGLSRWTRPAAVELQAILTTFADQPERADNWYEHGIQEHLKAGAAYACVDVPTSDWVEIDDLRDLEAARALPL